MILGINGYAGTGKDTVGKIIQFINCKETGEVTLEDCIQDSAEHAWWLEDQSRWEIKKYAGKLKQIASILTGISVEKFEDQDFKNTILDSVWSTVVKQSDGFPWLTKDRFILKSMMVREFLQKLGTDALRTGLHTETWVNALMADYKPSYERDIYKHKDGRSTASLRKDGLLEKELLEKENWNLINTFSDGFPNWIITDVRFPNEAQAIKDRGGKVIRIDRPGVKPINDHPSEIALDTYDQFDYKIMNGSDLTALAYTVECMMHEFNL